MMADQYDDITGDDDGGNGSGSGTPPVAAPIAAPIAAPEAAQASDTSTPQASSEDHHAAIAAMIPSDAERDALAARVIAGLADGTDVQIEASGDADKFATHVAGLQAHLQGQADEFVRSQGIDVEDFYRFVRFQGREAMRSVALTLYHAQGDAAYALTPLIQQYLRTATGRR
jgi:hypothetical protein